MNRFTNPELNALYMIKWCLSVLISFIVVAYSFGQNNKQYNFKINGTINADAGMVSLQFFKDYISSKDKELETKVKDGKFTISGYISESQSVFLLFDERYVSSDFIIEKGVQTISVNVDSTREVPMVSNKTMQKEYPQYVAFYKQQKIKYAIFDQKEDSLRRHYNLPEDIKFNMKKKRDILDRESDRLLLTYTQMHPNSNIAFWKLVRLMSWGYEPIFDSIYHAYSGVLKNGYAGYILKKKLDVGRQTSVGKQFPELSCVNNTNDKFSTSLFQKNKMTLVDFWYSRCNPCRAQFNGMKELYRQFGDKGFEIVGISVDSDADKINWGKTILNENLSWLQYLDLNGKAAKSLSIYVYPTNFLVDSTGKIIAKNVSLEELKSILGKVIE
ncbi:MAG: TlpA disulfide reductase family protein [Bacteroidota bacterium]|nr:TlpA disulfide reductase family protein [Bacteroidota bacterium]